MINPSNAKNYIERGAIKLYDKDDFKGAIEDLTKAIEIKPNYEDAYFDRGFAK